MFPSVNAVLQKTELVQNGSSDRWDVGDQSVVTAENLGDSGRQRPSEARVNQLKPIEEEL